MALLLAAFVGGGFLFWLRPWAADPEEEDDGLPLPDGAVLLGSSSLPFKGTIGPWVSIDGGKTIVLGNGRRIRAIDVATRRELRSWVADKRFPTGLAATSDGSRIASTSGYDEYVRVWDGGTGKLLNRYNPHGSYARGALAISPDGKAIASVGFERPKSNSHTADLRWNDYGLRVCDAVTGEEYPGFKGGLPGAGVPAFSPDGRTLAWVNGAHFAFYNKTQPIHLRPLAGGADRVFEVKPGASDKVGGLDLAFSPDGKLLAVHLVNGEVSVWDVTAGAERRRFAPIRDDPPYHNFLFHIAKFAPDSNTLLTGRLHQRGGESTSTLIVHDVAAGTSRTLATDAPIGNGVEFTPDGKAVFTVREDRNVQSWDLATGKETAPPGHRGPVKSVALSADGKTVATASADKSVRLWDRAGGKEQRTLNGHDAGVVGVVFLPDGKTLASADWDGTVVVWDVTAGKERKRIAAHKEGLDSFALSPDGTVLATGGRDKVVRLLATDTWTERRAMAGHPGWVVRLVFTPDGKRLLSSGRTDHSTPKGGYLPDDEFFRMWDVVTGSPVAEFNARKARGAGFVAISPDGERVVSHTSDRNVGLVQEWELATGRVLGDIGPLEKGTKPGPLGFSPDGRTLACIPCYYSEGGGAAITLLDMTTRKPIARLAGHSAWVNAGVFSPDGRFLVSGSDDGTAIVWDLQKLAPGG